MKLIREHLPGILVYGTFSLGFFALFVSQIGLIRTAKVLVLPVLIIVPIVAIMKSRALATRFTRLHKWFSVLVLVGVAALVLLFLIKAYDPNKCATDRNSYEYC